MNAHRIRRALLLLAATGAAVLALRHLAALGASWSAALHLITGLPWQWPLLLGAVWILGLSAHTWVLTASLPGLTHRRALTLNLAGSAVSNVFPLGGVAGTALNFGMVRGWGHSARDFARFTIVSKAWDVAAKLVLPLLALVALLGLDELEPTRHTAGWLGLAVLSAAVGALVVTALLGRAKPLLAVVRFAERFRRDRTGTWTASVETLLADTSRLVRRRWAGLSGGMSAYLVLQGALFWLCLHAVGVHLPVVVVLTGLVAERVLTLLAVTPGGSGFVEAGTVALLVALGAAATGVLAGVLLYRAFVFAAEIPVGGIATAFWALGRRATA
ncbi:lysylphosphatidylglycerol synthase domain-containing protein [Cryptosporangium arvum]|uniref:Putative integral membrane protein n=1 Tax=Cryptosporangium arvum DSM 44712 TaxID=927661 RepID=A0A010ZV71_9ACTN|nr:lysylphosphatidylglycerol synthase domain-containing protein [Cryptosporangium arvum]EXG82594.1 putative integral membrane protein [Cryptosporangium arvum DSM 44712]